MVIGDINANGMTLKTPVSLGGTTGYVVLQLYENQVERDYLMATNLRAGMGFSNSYLIAGMR